MERSRIVKDLFPQEPVKQPDRQKWELLNIKPVDMPVESYGECNKKWCRYIGILGNGLCDHCWDRSSRSDGVRPKEDTATWEIVEYLIDKLKGGS